MKHSLPLTDHPSGTDLKVTGFTAGHRALGRLLSLGLTPGCPIRLLTNDGGQVRLTVRGADLVLGRGMAEKVLAEPAE